MPTTMPPREERKNFTKIPLPPPPRADEQGKDSPPPRSARPPREPREPRAEEDDRGEDDPAFTNVFLNVGRRDGLSQDDLQRLLTDKAGLIDADVGHVRLRDRISFVGIRKERADEAIKALIGLNVGERVLNAEVARGR